MLSGGCWNRRRVQGFAQSLRIAFRAILPFAGLGKDVVALGVNPPISATIESLELPRPREQVEGFPQEVVRQPTEELVPLPETVHLPGMDSFSAYMLHDEVGGLTRQARD